MTKSERPIEASGPADPLKAPRITPEDIQAKEFRIAKLRGYKERDVDEFLDELTLSWTAVLEENRRLQMHESTSPAVRAPEFDDLTRRADDIIRRGEEQAAQVLRRAEARAAGIAAGSAPDGERAAVEAFLRRERAFIQSLAALVQDHAEGVKGMAREIFSQGSSKPSQTDLAPPEQPSASIGEATRDREPEPESASEPQPESASEPEPESASEPETEPIRIEDPEPARVRTTGNDQDNESKDKRDLSLRELFWGEE